MKQPICKISFVFFVAWCFGSQAAFSQPAEKGRLSISISYYAVNDQIPYLVAKVKTKVGGRFRPVAAIPLKLYLNDDSAGHLIAGIVTGNNGEASAVIPPSLGREWKRSPKKDFLAIFPGDSSYKPAEGDLTVTRAKLLVDTAAGKKITATLLEWKDTAWIPVKGVDVAIAIKRLNAWLNVNQTATYTTDSTGSVQAEFKRDSIPGDAAGDIVIAARVDDNDSYGNLLQEKHVPWGARFVDENTFSQRSLFATRNKAPIWLLFMSYSIVIVVWGVLAILIYYLIRIRKLGKTSADQARI